MMNKWLILMAISVLPFFINDAFAQTEVNVTSTTPCFMNYTTTGIDMLQNCGFDTDYMGAVTLPFEWVTGGLFSMIVVVILVIMSYIKYHTVIYPIIIGLVMLPTSYYLFPDMFLSFAFIALAIGIGAIIWRIYVIETRG